jgi:DNA primase
MSSYVIEAISKSLKITDYLTGKGVTPVRNHGDHYVYRCPIPSHANDRQPSFYVYDKPEGQDYWCFGCKSGCGIINLVADMEGIQIRDAVKKLSQGISLDVDDILDTIVKEIIAQNEGANKKAKDLEAEALALSLFISTHMRDFLIKVQYAKEDLEKAEKLFKLTDELCQGNRIKDLEEVIRIIPEQTKKRYLAFMDEVRQRELSQIAQSKQNHA